MILRVTPVAQLKGRVFLPASKSYSIRAFMISSLGGRSSITHPSNCDDAVVAKNVAHALGANIKRLKDNRWQIVADMNKPLPDKIHVKESGTVLRLTIPLAAMRDSATRITGEGTLKGRPNLYLNQTLRQMGANVHGTGDVEGVPIVVQPGRLTGGSIKINGSVSSQFISALLMTMPFLPEDSQLKLTGKVVSADYIQMTLMMMRKAGIKVQGVNGKSFTVRAQQRYRGLGSFTVPSDDGLAAFLLAAAALQSSAITLDGHFQSDLPQAHAHIYDFMTRMGVSFRKTPRSIQLRGPFELKGGRFSLKNCPDLVPIMSILALFAKGTTRLCDIGHARVKESDRISDLREELLKIGANVSETKDQLIIKPSGHYKADRLLDPHHDHRLAMAFAVLGLKIGVRIKDVECTHKSYPDFLRDLQTLGAQLYQGKKRLRVV
ncbi:MAG: 3-phosphoshikimate 1-carboxyvinyltransferase [Candidatus Omnitrophica bacterium]|nr:3-phosphoshikimate 1-carboxyvinyltransferase [Candidatus Omnitrophota bacterium]